MRKDIWGGWWWGGAGV